MENVSILARASIPGDRVLVLDCPFVNRLLMVVGPQGVDWGFC